MSVSKDICLLSGRGECLSPSPDRKSSVIKGSMIVSLSEDLISPVEQDSTPTTEKLKAVTAVGSPVSDNMSWSVVLIVLSEDLSAGGMSISSDNFLRSLTKAIIRVERRIASTRVLSSEAAGGSGLVFGIIDSLAGLTSLSSNAKSTMTGSSLGDAGI